ncbi:hypothetical protein KIPB_003751 [Kipferlia bialata]|uniref:Uncharacterized protein n=1 Tax=Kipferlia bialata TaxID=797122 RepID=A0A9K3GGX7_9EUKA|nr:hypothetical protein KIPB_003751 [Kipferlia bialata]|eukprot:g3751.t1
MTEDAQMVATTLRGLYGKLGQSLNRKAAAEKSQCETALDLLKPSRTPPVLPPLLPTLLEAPISVLSNCGGQPKLAVTASASLLTCLSALQTRDHFFLPGDVASIVHTASYKKTPMSVAITLVSLLPSIFQHNRDSASLLSGLKTVCSLRDKDKKRRVYATLEAVFADTCQAVLVTGADPTDIHSMRCCVALLDELLVPITPSHSGTIHRIPRTVALTSLFNVLGSPLFLQRRSVPQIKEWVGTRLEPALTRLTRQHLGGKGVVLEGDVKEAAGAECDHYLRALPIAIRLAVQPVQDDTPEAAQAEGATYIPMLVRHVLGLVGARRKDTVRLGLLLLRCLMPDRPTATRVLRLVRQEGKTEGGSGCYSLFSGVAQAILHQGIQPSEQDTDTELLSLFQGQNTSLDHMLGGFPVSLGQHESPGRLGLGVLWQGLDALTSYTLVADIAHSPSAMDTFAGLAEDLAVPVTVACLGSSSATAHKTKGLRHVLLGAVGLVMQTLSASCPPTGCGQGEEASTPRGKCTARLSAVASSVVSLTSRFVLALLKDGTASGYGAVGVAALRQTSLPTLSLSPFSSLPATHADSEAETYRALLAGSTSLLVSFSASPLLTANTQLRLLCQSAVAAAEVSIVATVCGTDPSHLSPQHFVSTRDRIGSQHRLDREGGTETPHTNDSLTKTLSLISSVYSDKALAKALPAMEAYAPGAVEAHVAALCEMALTQFGTPTYLSLSLSRVVACASSADVHYSAVFRGASAVLGALIDPTLHSNCRHALFQFASAYCSALVLTCNAVSVPDRQEGDVSDSDILSVLLRPLEPLPTGPLSPDLSKALLAETTSAIHSVLAATQAHLSVGGWDTVGYLARRVASYVDADTPQAQDRERLDALDMQEWLAHVCTPRQVVPGVRAMVTELPVAVFHILDIASRAVLSDSLSSSDASPAKVSTQAQMDIVRALTQGVWNHRYQSDPLDDRTFSLIETLGRVVSRPCPASDKGGPNPVTLSVMAVYGLASLATEGRFEVRSAVEKTLFDHIPSVLRSLYQSEDHSAWLLLFRGVVCPTVLTLMGIVTNMYRNPTPLAGRSPLSPANPDNTHSQWLSTARSILPRMSRLLGTLADTKLGGEPLYAGARLAPLWHWAVLCLLDAADMASACGDLSLAGFVVDEYTALVSCPAYVQHMLETEACDESVELSYAAQEASLGVGVQWECLTEDYFCPVSTGPASVALWCRLLSLLEAEALLEDGDRLGRMLAAITRYTPRYSLQSQTVTLESLRYRVLHDIMHIVCTLDQSSAHVKVCLDSLSVQYTRWSLALAGGDKERHTWCPERVAALSEYVHTVAQHCLFDSDRQGWHVLDWAQGTGPADLFSMLDGMCMGGDYDRAMHPSEEGEGECVWPSRTEAVFTQGMALLEQLLVGADSSPSLAVVAPIVLVTLSQGLVYRSMQVRDGQGDMPRRELVALSKLHAKLCLATLTGAKAVGEAQAETQTEEETKGEDRTADSLWAHLQETAHLFVSEEGGLSLGNPLLLVRGALVSCLRDMLDIQRPCDTRLREAVTLFLHGVDSAVRSRAPPSLSLDTMAPVYGLDTCAVSTRVVFDACLSGLLLLSHEGYHPALSALYEYVVDGVHWYTDLTAVLGECPLSHTRQECFGLLLSQYLSLTVPHTPATAAYFVPSVPMSPPEAEAEAEAEAVVPCGQLHLVALLPHLYPLFATRNAGVRDTVKAMHERGLKGLRLTP